MNEQMVAYGVGCTWWDTKANVATIPASGLPCCPFCGSVLFESDAASWRAGVERHAVQHDDPGYVRFIDWLRGRSCREFPGGAAQARETFNAEEDK